MTFHILLLSVCRKVNVNIMKYRYWIIQIVETYSEPCKTSKIELLPKTVKSFQVLAIFTKSSILDTRQGCE